MAIVTPIGLAVVAGIALAVAMTGCRLDEPPPEAGILPTIHLGLPKQPLNAAWFIALDQGLFEKEGITVIEHPYDIGVHALQAVVDRQIDLALVADTPVVFAVLGGSDLSIVATTYHSRDSMSVAALANAGIRVPADLRGKTVGFVPKTSMHFFLDTFLLANGIAAADLNRLALRPDQVIPHLENGQIEAVAAWEPVRTQIREALGPRLVEFGGADLYALRFNLVGMTDLVAARRRELVAMLRALQRANDWLARHPTDATQLVARKLETPQLRSLDPSEFHLTLDQAMLVALEDQARWAMSAGLAPEKSDLNFLRHIAPEAMREAMPDQVSLVH